MDIKYPDFKNVPCQQLGLEYFYYVEREIQPGKSKKGKSNYLDEEAAKKACDLCHMKTECLTWALHREHFGIWGGTNQRERRDLRKKLGIVVEEPHNLK